MASGESSGIATFQSEAGAICKEEGARRWSLLGGRRLAAAEGVDRDVSAMGLQPRCKDNMKGDMREEREKKKR